jgi:hypothetical protein
VGRRRQVGVRSNQAPSCVVRREARAHFLPQRDHWIRCLALVVLLADKSEGHCRVCPDDVAARSDSGDHDPRLMADGCGFDSLNCVVQVLVDV